MFCVACDLCGSVSWGVIWGVFLARGGVKLSSQIERAAAAAAAAEALAARSFLKDLM